MKTREVGVVNTIEAALLALSAQDQDFARIQNGVGFNGRDTGFGNSLAQQIREGRELSSKQRASAYKMLRTYKRQLSGYGIDYDAIAPVEQQEKTGVRVVHYRDGKFVVAIPYSDSDARDAFKVNVPGRAWDGENKFWTAPASSAAQIVAFANAFGFDISDEASAFVSSSPAPEVAVTIVTPQAVAKTGRLAVSEDGKTARVLFDGFPGSEVIGRIKQIPGRTYDPTDKVWSIPVSFASISAVRAFATEFGLAIDGEDRIDNAERDLLQSVADSAALDADIQIDGLGLELMPFQRAGVAYALKNLSKGKGVYICDEMGLGKTPQSLAVLQAENLYPALAVVPKVVWLNWAREVAKWVPGKKVVLLAGKSVNKATRAAAASCGATVVSLDEQIPADADIVVINYDILTKWAKPVTANRSWMATGVLAEFPFKAMIFDEAHMLKERKSQRTNAAVGLVKKHGDARVLALSGTPVPNRPSELITIVKDILNRLPEVGGWNTLWGYHCQSDSSGSYDLAGLNEKMRSSFYVRRTKKDVLPELPPVRWVPVSVEMTNPARYWEVARDITAWIREKLSKDTAFQAAVADLSEGEKVAVTEGEVAERAVRSQGTHEMLVKLGALRQVAADEKLDATISWLESFLEDTTTNGTGEKIIVFGIHRAINERVATHFNAPIIYGGMDSAARFEAEQKFQTDPNCRVLVCSIDAAGVGLTLTAASNVAFIEVPWRPMDIDQAVARAYGRLSDLHGVNAYLISSPGTIEDRIINLVEKKRSVTDAVSDGDTSVAAALLRDLLKEV